MGKSGANERNESSLSNCRVQPALSKKKDGLILEKILKIRKIGLIRKWRRHILIPLNPHSTKYRINDMFPNPSHQCTKSLTFNIVR